MKKILKLFVWLVLSPVAFGLSNPEFLLAEYEHGAFELVHKGASATLFTDQDAAASITIALSNLQSDIEKVTGAKPVLTQQSNKLGRFTVIAGQIGKSPIIDQLISEARLDISAINNRWEGYTIQTIDSPVEGVEKALVIAGNDRRAVAYGIYEISEQIGISPWYWWADVPIKPKKNLHIKSDLQFDDFPTVKYRGIFLNDEAPALSGWVHEKFGNYNHHFYQNVFELLTRLKANYLWPAMWNNAFNDDDPENMQLAHDYGIFMGTSHHEPMMRADKEWNRYGTGPWDYEKNPEKLYQFWHDGAKRNKDFDSIYTLGMRGQEDTPMSDEQNIELLEKIVADQRAILADVFKNTRLSDIPQVWALYKEVQGYYENGMRVPDDVTLLWADDNWGNIRRLPTDAERDRAGGAGVYYHFDYVGGPRSYRWMNVTPIAKIWEQMNLANAYGANRIWIVNVGDLKPQEFPMEFFLRMAWSPDQWPKERLVEFGQLWAEREFGETYSEDIERIITGYSRHNGRRKPELMSPEVYSQLHYNEADRISAELEELLQSAEAIASELPAQYQSAFFQLVLHPIKATYIINEMYNTTAKNRLYAHQGRNSTAALGEKVQQLFDADERLSQKYHSINGGKWNHFMSQPHIGYTHWNNPPANTQPVIYQYVPHDQPDMGVAIEGSAQAWPQTSNLQLPEFSPFGAGAYFIDVYNKGTKAFEFTATANAPWISLSTDSGQITTEERIWVGIDWAKAPQGEFSGEVFVKGTGWGGARVKVKGSLPDQQTRAKLHGFVEANGYISIEAANYTSKARVAGSQWETIPNHGHTDASIAVFPSPLAPFENLEDAPWVEYDIYALSQSQALVTGVFAPTLEFTPGNRLRYAISIDDEAPQVMTLLNDLSHSNWQESVIKGVRTSTSQHSLAPGPHKLRIYALDPGVVLQKILIDTGGLKESYLGPQQSHFQEGRDS